MSLPPQSIVAVVVLACLAARANAYVAQGGDEPIGRLADSPPPQLVDLLERRDARADGWQSEVDSERAQKVLYALAGLVTRQPGECEASIAELCTADVRAGELRPAALELVHEAGELRVHRPPEAWNAEFLHEGAAGLCAALSGLGNVHADGVEPKASIKIFAIEELTGGFATRSYVWIASRSAKGGVQQNGTWRCEWVRGENDAQPRLRSVVLERYDEASDSRPSPWFSDCTQDALGGTLALQRQLVHGIDHWAGRIDAHLGITLGGYEGLCVGDADGDGLEDLYVGQPGGLPNALFLQQPDGRFREVAAESGVDWLDPTPSALFCDLDRDGDLDLAIQTDPHLLLMENDGRARFTLRAAQRTWGTESIAAADYDEDGDLDLYVCNYMIPDSAERAPLPYHDANNGRANVLLRNDVGGGEWKFVEVTEEVGLDHHNHRYSFAACWEDYDDDGDIDLYVANDFGRNNLYRNDGGRFRDVAAHAGVEDMAAGMGVSFGDYDQDGRVDLHVGNMFSSAGGRIAFQRRFMEGASAELRASYQRHARGNSLFRNLGDGTFAEVSERAGITMGRWAWGSTFVDFDGDGRPDLFTPNGFLTGEDPEDL
ncbi:MAG: VCBS repeat-containing protein [Planctomycetota bacterium]|nr:VCBS repeat-containing protein [Planctomycetota bacterium]